MKVFFSIVTITLNSEAYLEETIQSIQEQDYPYLEHIVVDGGSTDRTLDILKSHGRSIKFISEPDKGRSDAMNKGIGMAQGNIISHLHSDDKLLPGTLTKVAKLFEERPLTHWIYGGAEYIDSEGTKIKKIKLKRYSYKALKGLNCIVHPSVFIKKEVFTKVGYFDLDLRYAMDYDMWVRIGKFYLPYQSGEILSSFRLHEGSLTATEYLRSFDEEYKVRLSHYSNEGVCERVFQYTKYRAWKVVKILKPF